MIATMRRKRRLVLVVVLVLAIGATVSWLQLNRGGASVALTFVGYTNRPVTVTWLPGNVSFYSQATNGTSTTRSLEMRFARMLVTNNGAISVEVWNGIRSANPNAPGFVPFGGWPVQMLHPGETTVLEIGPMPGIFGNSWRTEIGYQPHSFAERIYARVLASTNSSAQRFLSLFWYSPDVVWVDSGWITNVDASDYVLGMSASATPTRLLEPISGAVPFVPVLWPARREYHITAPPALAPLHLPPLPPRSPAPRAQ
jgi:hypothetical protein